MSKIIELTRRVPGVTHTDRIVLYSLKLYNDLHKKGIVPNSSLNVTKAGLKDLEGFKATDEEIRVGIAYLKQEGVIPNVGSEHI